MTRLRLTLAALALIASAGCTAAPVEPPPVEAAPVKPAIGDFPAHPKRRWKPRPKVGPAKLRAPDVNIDLNDYDPLSGLPAEAM